MEKREKWAWQDRWDCQGEVVAKHRDGCSCTWGANNRLHWEGDISAKWTAGERCYGQNRAQQEEGGLSLKSTGPLYLLTSEDKSQEVIGQAWRGVPGPSGAQEGHS